MKTQTTVLMFTKIFRVTLIYFTLCFWGEGVGNAAETRLLLSDGWQIRSSSQVKEEGDVVSTGEFTPERWYPTSVPSTVLNALIENKVYPDMRVGLNSFRIPDASDQFNQEHDLFKYSHLPDKRNPWKDPYWYRTEFDLPNTAKGRRVWLDFQGINYRADVWLNGRKVADHEEMVGIYRCFRFDVTESAKPGEKNCLAVKVQHRSIDRFTSAGQ